MSDLKQHLAENLSVLTDISFKELSHYSVSLLSAMLDIHNEEVDAKKGVDHADTGYIK